MPSADQHDRRPPKPRKKQPTAAQNRAAFAEIRRQVRAREAGKVRPNPDQRPQPRVTQPRPVATGRQNPDQQAPRTTASRKVEAKVQREVQFKVKQARTWKAAAAAAEKQALARETERRRTKTEASKNFLQKITSTRPDGPALSRRELGMDTNRDGMVSAGELRAIRPRRAEQEFLQKKLVAPSLAILNETLRPIHVVAAGADAGLSGRNPLPAAGKALKTNKGPLFGDILRKHKVPGAGVLGFVADVAADPLTWTTGGTASVGRRAAVKQATRVTQAAARGADQAASRAEADALRKALARNVSQAEAKKRAAKAAKDAREAHIDAGAARAQRVKDKADAGPRGVVVRVGGREVPGMAKATAPVGRAIRAGAGKAPKSARNVGTGAHKIVREVHPQLKPPGAPRAEFNAVRDVTRQARASDNQATQTLMREARELQKQIGAKNFDDVINAIELGKIKTLPANLQDPATFLRNRFRYMERTTRAAGIRQGSIRNYFPHATVREIDDQAPILDVSRSGGSSVKAQGSSKKRTRLGTVRDLNAAGSGSGMNPLAKISTDIPSVYANRGHEAAHLTNQTRFLADLADAGRAFKGTVGDKDVLLRFSTGADGRRAVQTLSSREAADEQTRMVLRQQAKNRQLTKEEQKFLKAGHGRLVVMNKGTAKDALSQMQRRAEDRSSAGRVLDKASGTWKTVATATPGFHARNYIGAIDQMYKTVDGNRMPAAYKAGRKGVKALNKDERSPLSNGSAAVGSTIKVGGKDMPLEKFLAGAKRQGVVRSGFYGRELEDMLQGAGKFKAPTRGPAKGTRTKVRQTARGGADALKRYTSNLEDVFRLGTYRDGLDKGLTPAQAARRSMETHIDYGDISNLERQLRRFLPFYTFSARNTPFMAKKLITNPGKTSTYAKAREESARAVGYENAAAADGEMSEYDQRQAPIYYRNPLTGKVNALSAGLPSVGAYDELPTSAKPSDAGKYIGELGKFGVGMLNPVFGIPIELLANVQFFTRRPIDDPNSPLVAAPSWVMRLPKSQQERLGVVSAPDKRTGKRVPHWPGKVDYGFKKFPGPFYLANQIATSGTSRRGQTQEETIISGLTGIKSVPMDPVTTMLGVLYERKGKVEKEIDRFNRQAIPITPEQVARKQELRLIEQNLVQLSRKRGDKVLPGQSVRSLGTAAPSSKAAPKPASTDPIDMALDAMPDDATATQADPIDMLLDQMP